MGKAQDYSHVPVIEVSRLAGTAADRQAVATQLGEACRESGSFYVRLLSSFSGIRRPLAPTRSPRRACASCRAKGTPDRSRRSR